jgi:hypothetical protein
MDNRIRSLAVSDYRLDFAESEVRLVVYPEHMTPGTRVRGRLMGPSSAYASTVEVAYHWREVTRGADHIVLRAVIPEPCFWEPKKAFQYAGPVEMWQDDACCERRSLSHGLAQVRLTPQALVLNGKPLALRGTTHAPQSAIEARELHERGYNLLLAREPTRDTWALAARFGYFVLAHVVDLATLVAAPAEIDASPSTLGWVLSPEQLERVDPAHAARCGKVGVELTAVPAQPLPAQVAFVLCTAQHLPAMAELALPKLVIGSEGQPSAGVLGWIELE